MNTPKTGLAQEATRHCISCGTRCGWVSLEVWLRARQRCRRCRMDTPLLLFDPQAYPSYIPPAGPELNWFQASKRQRLATAPQA